MGSHSYLMNLRGSCNNHGSGDITIGKGGVNHGEIINGSSDGCTRGNYHNKSLQNLVVFTGALTNEPSMLNSLPASDLNGVRFTGKLTNEPLQNLVVFTGALTNEPSMLNGQPASDLNGVPIRSYLI